MVRKGTGGRDGEADWTSAGTTLSRVDAMVESVGVQAKATTKLTWGNVVKDGAAVHTYCTLANAAFPSFVPRFVQLSSTTRRFGLKLKS